MTKNKNPLKRVLNDFVTQNNLEHGLNEVNVKEIWKNLMGNGVNNYTTKIMLRNNTLHVYLNSSTLRQELSYGKDKIIKLLNEELNQPLIKNIVFS